MSQRLIFSIASLMILLGGAILGVPGETLECQSAEVEPGAAPVLVCDGDVALTLESLTSAPVLIAFGAILAFVKAISTRVSSGQMNPGDLVALLGMRSFWATAVVVVATGLNLAGIDVLNKPELQDQIVLVATTLVGILTYTFADRQPGALP